jgi:hypothetical protein
MYNTHSKHFLPGATRSLEGSEICMKRTERNKGIAKKATPCFIKLYTNRSLKNLREKLRQVLLAKGYFGIVYDHTRNTHHIVSVPERFKMADVIDMGSDIWVCRRKPLGGNHKIRAHGA